MSEKERLPTLLSAERSEISDERAATQELRQKTDELLGRIKDACNKLTNYAQNAKT